MSPPQQAASEGKLEPEFPEWLGDLKETKAEGLCYFLKPEFGGGFQSCQEFDDLLGSKVFVFNVEPRLPLLGPLGVLARGPFPPLDLIAFFDTGVAWTNDEGPDFIGCDTCVRDFISSVGVGFRFNLFGLLSLEGHYVNPLYRENKDWFFQFLANTGI